MTRDARDPRDGSDDGPADVRRAAERGGYRDECPRCRRVAATTGAAACPEHYEPVRARTDGGADDA